MYALKKNILRYLRVCILFAVVLIFATFPLVFKCLDHIPGFFSTDEPYGALWNFWRIKHSLDNDLSLRVTRLIAYPFGIDTYESRVPHIWQGLKFMLSLTSTPALGNNIEIIVNFLLSALFCWFSL